MFRYLIITFLLFLSCTLFGQVPNPYLFLEWRDSKDYTLQVGKLDFTDLFDCTIDLEDEFVSNEQSVDNYYQDLNKTINDLSVDKSDVLIYLHGFGAYRSYFVKTINSTLQKEIVNKEGTDIGLQLTMSWSVGYNYLAGIPKSINLGEYYGDILVRSIKMIKAKNPDSKIHLITHSMGNRVFYGVFNRLKEAFDCPVIDHHVMAAPDIEPTAYLDGQPLDSIEYVVKDLSIYRHNTDRILTFSGEITESPRVGLVGFSDSLYMEIPEMIRIVDCSLLNDNERFDIGNHNYYYQSPTVREDIYHILIDDQSALDKNRKTLNHPRNFVLNFDH